MDPASIIALLTVSATVITGLITTIFHSMSLSRCKYVDCCFECIKCKRDVLSEETYTNEQDRNASVIDSVEARPV